MYGIILIGVMIATGGAIAFIGDKLGTKIGKKRLSIFGLRPRHTSMIITVITGILITAFSIGTMAIVSKDVRTALFGLEELNSSLRLTKRALDEATENLAQMHAEFNRAETELSNARTEIAKLKNEQDELNAESERLREGNERLEAEKFELTEQNENLVSVNKNLASTNDELTGTNKNLSRVNQELSGTNENLARVNRELTGTNKKLASDNQKLTDTNENLSKVKAELEDSNKRLNEFNVTLTADNEKLSKDNAELEEHAKNLRDGLIAMREGDIVFRAGEVLAAAVIKGNRTDEDITEDINALADAASKNIAEHFGDNTDSSVWIYQPELQRTIDEISASPQDMVLRITAAGNLVRGEPIRTNLSLFPNNKVFDANEFIFSHEYEVKSEDDAEDIVRNFLSEINHAAVVKGILADPITGTVGVMEGSQLYELIEEIETARSKIILTAYAREDVYSIGPLRLNIRFEQKADI